MYFQVPASDDFQIEWLKRDGFQIEYLKNGKVYAYKYTTEKEEKEKENASTVDST